MATKASRRTSRAVNVVALGIKQTSQRRDTPNDHRNDINGNSAGQTPDAIVGATALLLLSLTASPSFAQGLQPGEAFATRFSGTAPGADGLPAIDTQGTVGSILDLRAPGQPAQGQHWINEPQRNPVTAAQTGQVFGVAFDDATPPNIYVTATAAFGLHRTADNAQWMPGMFGEGGPGAIYKLDAANGYKPQHFATITLNGRPNSGAALGNIAFDRWNKQFLVSDLETGMIHRISIDGGDLGSFDHGTQGRTSFVDAQSGQPMSMKPVAFNPGSQARIANCEGRFDTTPECWNVAEFKPPRVGSRRVERSERRNPPVLRRGEHPGPRRRDWASLPDDDKRNTLWSVRLGPDGSFDDGGVRREFVLPDFFANPNDVARAGYSRPVSDITFPACSGRPVMLVAERGGLRNLGLGQENAFATPHESRTIRYQLDQSGTWRAVGRYDVGMYDRSKEGAPYINANCAGGATFGPGYTDGRATGPADGFVWISGDKLCSPDGPCNPAGGIPQQPAQQVSTQGGPEIQMDDSEVHGVQGQPEDMYNALVPPTANVENQQTPANSDRSGSGLHGRPRHQRRCGRQHDPRPGRQERRDHDRRHQRVPDLPAGQCGLLGGLPAVRCRRRITAAASATTGAGSHARYFSHWRWHSHSRWASHDRRWSTGHYRFWSDGHWRNLSPSHRRHMSPTHWRYMSPTHYRRLSPEHRRELSPTHNRYLSPTHHRGLSPDAPAAD